MSLTLTTTRSIYWYFLLLNIISCVNFKNFLAAILSAQKGLQVLQNLNFAKLLDLDPQAVNAAQNFGTEMGNRIGSVCLKLFYKIECAVRVYFLSAILFPAWLM